MCIRDREYIKQIPNMSGVVTAVYEAEVGEVWPEEKIARLKDLCKKAGLETEVIESVPVHEDIKLGKPTRDRLIENYAKTIRNLEKYGVKSVSYTHLARKGISLKIRLTVKSLVSAGVIILAVVLPQLVHLAAGPSGGMTWLPMYLSLIHI